jgi:hypothetical protein
VFDRNLQCHAVRGANTNGMLECKSLSKIEHRNHSNPKQSRIHGLKSSTVPRLEDRVAKVVVHVVFPLVPRPSL